MPRLTPQTLRDLAPAVMPSMLKCDFADLAGEIDALDPHTGVYHWDVMDGAFVPNLSYGAMVIADARRRTDRPFEAHLMIADPAQYVGEYLDAGCDLVTFHIEAVPEPADLLDHIRSKGALAGIAMNPGTPVSALTPAVGHADVVLTMSVNPGFGGQAFMPETLPKVAEAIELFGPDVAMSIDGGIAGGTIGRAAEAGCTMFVVGSGIFSSAPDRRATYGSSIDRLRSAATP